MGSSILNTYKTFFVLSNLQDHMLRVGTLVKVYLDKIEENTFKKYFNFTKDELTLAALTHDLGKFVEIDLDFSLKLFPEQFTSGQIEKLKVQQKEYIKKYGCSAHEATFSMLRNIGISNELSTMASLVKFTNAPFAYRYKIYDLMLLIYADQRVSPFGIDTLTNRINEGLKRYLRRFNALAKSGNTLEYKNVIQQAKIEHKYIAGILTKIEKALLKINPAFKKVYQNIEWLNKQVSKYTPELLDLELN